jgi:hypothetical protein
LKDQWHRNSVNLDSLSQNLEKFFTENLFKTETEKTNDVYKIDVTGLHFKLTVRILGSPDDFTVEFIPDQRASGFISPKMVLSYIASLFGTGKLFLDEVAYQKELADLEDKFWNYVDSQIDTLRNSA